MELSEQSLKALGKAKKKLVKGEDKLTQAKSRIYSKVKIEGGKPVRRFYFNPSPEFKALHDGTAKKKRLAEINDRKRFANCLASMFRAACRGVVETLNEDDTPKSNKKFTRIVNFQPEFVEQLPSAN